MRVDLFMSDSISLAGRKVSRPHELRRLADLAHPQTAPKPSVLVASARELAALAPTVFAPFFETGLRVIVTEAMPGSPMPRLPREVIHCTLPHLDSREEWRLLSAFINSAIDILVLLEESRRKQHDLEELIRIGVLLSSEKDTAKLLGLILSKAREVTNADAGSLYLLEEREGKRRLVFKLAQNDSVPLDINELPIPLNKQSIAGYTVLSGETLVIDDAYRLPPDKPYSHGRWMDAKIHYRTVTMLSAPLKNRTGEVFGCLQLINRKRQPGLRLVDELTALISVAPFDEHAVHIVSSLASLAAVTLEKNRLYDSIEHLFAGFVEASVKAIESRDPTTRGHSERVAKLTVGFADAVNRVQSGPLAAIRLSDDQRRELRYAALLHDFGKVGVRENVLTKAKKLHPEETAVLRERSLLVACAIKAQVWKSRAEILLEDGRESYLAQSSRLDAAEARLLDRLHGDLSMLWEANEPRVLASGGLERLMDMAESIYTTFEGEAYRLIDKRLAQVLSIPRGSLTEEERLEIESHVTHTYSFLSTIPWTKELARIPDIAFMHHEKLNGKGYPRGLSAPDIPPQVRMMTICDIFDALTASDRPYKRAVPTEKALDILRDEAHAGMLDPNLLDLFIEAKLFRLTLPEG